MIGFIQPALGTNYTGYLLCDGSWVDKAVYGDLYSVIGDDYGSTATEFRLPDYRDATLFGASPNHPLREVSGENKISLASLPIFDDSGDTELPSQANSFGASMDKIYSTDTGTQSEYFPKNHRVNFFIKY